MLGEKYVSRKSVRKLTIKLGVKELEYKGVDWIRLLKMGWNVVLKLCVS